MKNSKIIKIESFSPKNTERIAELLSKELSYGSIISLNGDLGAGKSVFSRGLIRGLGIDHNISSPTFNIVNEYMTPNNKIYHIDAYRLNDVEETFDIGLDEYLYDKKGICIIEWAEKIISILPKEYMKVTMVKDISIGENYRTIFFKPLGYYYEKILDNLYEKYKKVVLK